jgi:acyl-CoA thioesterase-1
VPSFSHLSWLRHGFPLLLLPCLIAVVSACATSGSSSPPTPIPTASSSARVTAPKLAPPLHGSYAALGASETYGIGAVPHTNGYAYLVAHALHTRHFVDVGIPGATLDQAYETELANALAIRPALCTVFFGVNDLRGGVTRDAFLQDLHDLVATLRSTRAQVIIVGIPDLAHVPAVAHLHIANLRSIVSAWNSGMAQVARQTGAHFLDLRQYSAELASHRAYVASDGLHPSNAGHARLAQVVVATVRQDRLWRRP